MRFLVALLLAAKVLSVPYESSFVTRPELRPPLPGHDIQVSPLLSGRALPIGTCNAGTPCENAACCGGNNNNLCGYSPEECGSGKPLE